MENYDHFALIESILDDNTYPLEVHERQALEQELADYYQCLSEIGEFDIELAYSELEREEI